MSFDPSILDILRPYNTAMFCASTVASLAVFSISIFSKRKRQFPARLILVFNGMAFLFTLNVALGSAFDYSQIPPLLQNDYPSIMCKLQGAAFQFLAMSLIYWYLLIYFTLYLIVCRSWTFRQVRKYQLSYTLVGVCMPLLFTIIPATLDAFGHDYGVLWCWMRQDGTAFKFSCMYGHLALVLTVSCYWLYRIVRRLNELQLNVFGLESLQRCSIFSCFYSSASSSAHFGPASSSVVSPSSPALPKSSLPMPLPSARPPSPARANASVPTTFTGGVRLEAAGDANGGKAALSSPSPPLPVDIIQSAKDILEGASEKQTRRVSNNQALTSVQPSLQSPGRNRAIEDSSMPLAYDYDYIAEEEEEGSLSSTSALGRRLAASAAAASASANGRIDAATDDGMHHETDESLTDLSEDSLSDTEGIERKQPPRKSVKQTQYFDKESQHPAVYSVKRQSHNTNVTSGAVAVNPLSVPFLHSVVPAPQSSPKRDVRMVIDDPRNLEEKAAAAAAGLGSRRISMSRSTLNSVDNESVASHVSPSPLIQEYIVRHIVFVSVIFLCFLQIQAYGINYEFASKGESTVPLWLCILEVSAVSFVGLNLLLVFGFTKENSRIIRGWWHVWIRRDWLREEWEERMERYEKERERRPSGVRPEKEKEKEKERDRRKKEEEWQWQHERERERDRKPHTPRGEHFLSSSPSTRHNALGPAAVAAHSYSSRMSPHLTSPSPRRLTETLVAPLPAAQTTVSVQDNGSSPISEQRQAEWSAPSVSTGMVLGTSESETNHLALRFG